MQYASGSAAVIGACFALTTSAYACDPVTKAWWQNKSVRHAADCSFTGGGRHDYLEGSKTIDLGNGRTVQVISDFSAQSAIVTDCEAPDQIQVYGTLAEADGAACESAVAYTNFAPPQGSLDVTIGASISELEAQVLARGYQANRGSYFDERGAKKRDYPNFYCGCKIHYPDSAGANK